MKIRLAFFVPVIIFLLFVVVSFWGLYAITTGQRSTSDIGFSMQGQPIPDIALASLNQHGQINADAPLDLGDWQGKAGGYAIQGLAARFVRAIDGSYSNIVGFSLYDVAAMLDAAGWRGTDQLPSQTPPSA